MDDNLKSKKFETKAVHLGRVPEDETGSVATPIYPSTTYRERFPGDESGYVYSRWTNPTRVALEKTLAELEGGHKSFFYSSGLAAVTAVLHLLKSGDHVVAVDLNHMPPEGLVLLVDGLDVHHVLDAPLDLEPVPVEDPD